MCDWDQQTAISQACTTLKSELQSVRGVRQRGRRKNNARPSELWKVHADAGNNMDKIDAFVSQARHSGYKERVVKRR